MEFECTSGFFGNSDLASYGENFAQQFDNMHFDFRMRCYKNIIPRIFTLGLKYNAIIIEKFVLPSYKFFWLFLYGLAECKFTVPENIVNHLQKLFNGQKFSHLLEYRCSHDNIKLMISIFGITKPSINCIDNIMITLFDEFKMWDKKYLYEDIDEIMKMNKNHFWWVVKSGVDDGIFDEEKLTLIAEKMRYSSYWRRRDRKRFCKLYGIPFLT